MKYVAVLLALLLTAPAGAQSSSAKVHDPWQSLAFLEGTWSAKATGAAGASAVGTYTFRTELGGDVLARHSTSGAACNGPATFDCDHGDLLYVYRDAPDAPLKAIYFDNEGHVIHYDVSTPDRTTAVFSSDASLPGPHFRLSYALDGAIMSGSFAVKPPGQDEWHTYLAWTGSLVHP